MLILHEQKPLAKANLFINKSYLPPPCALWIDHGLIVLSPRIVFEWKLSV